MKNFSLYLISATLLTPSVQAAYTVKSVIGLSGSVGFAQSSSQAQVSDTFTKLSFDKPVNHNTRILRGGLVLGTVLEGENSFIELNYQPDFGTNTSKKFLDNSSNATPVIDNLNLVLTQNMTHVMSLKAGHALTPSVDVFGKVDLLYSSFDFKYENAATGNSGRSKRHAFGIAPGVGLQKKFAQGRWLMRGEYSYEMYATVKTPDISKDINNTVKLTASPRNHVFKFSAIYRFDLS